MILEEETFQKFGYRSDVLSKSSNKYVVLLCDYCKVGTKESTINNRKAANAVVDKDACKTCRPIKTGDINLIKIGVRNVFQRKDVKEKIVETNLEKYGVEHPAQNKDVMDKMNQTSLDRYGVKNPMQAEEVKERHKANCLDKYGVENVSSVEEFKQKRRRTCLEKFGKNTYLGSEDCIGRVKDIYNTDNVFKLKQFQDKAISSKIKSGTIKVYEDKSIKDWADEKGFSRQHFNKIVNEFGWEEAIQTSKRITGVETIVKNILDGYNIEYVFDKSYKTYKPDFRLKNLIIECDSLFFHSDAMQKNDNYHLSKKEFYTSEGYRSLFFREDEIFNNESIIKSMILEELGLNDRIAAAECEEIQVNKAVGDKFLQDNSLEGVGEGEYLALKLNGEIVSLIQIWQSPDCWEISRFANKLGKSVVGGFSRLLSFFTVGFAPEKIVTFIDLRYGSGEYLTSFGFIKGKSYPSFKWTDGRNTFHRMKFPSNTGHDSGLYKIWDCGQLKFTK